MTRFIYVIGPLDGAKSLKIGIARDLGERLMTLQIGNPEPLAFHGAFPVAGTNYDAKRVEYLAHDILRDHRARGEWFMCNADKARAAIVEAIRRHQAQDHVVVAMKVLNSVRCGQLGRRIGTR